MTTPLHNLFSRFIAFGNFHSAFQKARKLKTFHSDVLQFEYNLENNLFRLQNEFSEQKYQHGGYHSFTVNDPKYREIRAAPFRDRVVHHALCNIIEPLFDSCFIFDSYACRKEKGTHRAMKRLKTFLQSIESSGAKPKAKRQSKEHPPIYCLKCDIKKYFASIDHGILLSMIAKKIKDSKILKVIEKIINSHWDNIEYKNLFEYRKTGIPIGNLTSQLFANIYLNELDQFVKHKLRVRYYIRYMDDFLFLSKSKRELWKTKQAVEQFLTEQLKLSLHPKKVTVFPVKDGIDFLGYRVFFPPNVRLRKGTVRRFMKKFKRKENGKTDSKALLQSIQSFRGFAKHGNSFALLCSFKIPELILKYRRNG